MEEEKNRAKLRRFAIVAGTLSALGGFLWFLTQAFHTGDLRAAVLAFPTGIVAAAVLLGGAWAAAKRGIAFWILAVACDLLVAIGPLAYGVDEDLFTAAFALGFGALLLTLVMKGLLPPAPQEKA